MRRNYAWEKGTEQQHILQNSRDISTFSNGSFLPPRFSNIPLLGVGHRYRENKIRGLPFLYYSIESELERYRGRIPRSFITDIFMLLYALQKTIRHPWYFFFRKRKRGGEKGHSVVWKWDSFVSFGLFCTDNFPILELSAHPAYIQISCGVLLSCKSRVPSPFCRKKVGS